MPLSGAAWLLLILGLNPAAVAADLGSGVVAAQPPGAVAGRETPWRYLVDEFAVFDTVLQPSQVLKLYENTEGARAYAKAGDVSGTCLLETY
jgi:hypothetical protein